MPTKEFSGNRQFMKLLSKALKSYDSIGKFEEDYDCRVLMADHGAGIKGVFFESDAAMTAFYLKFDH
jgi:hypothetical protein